MNAKLPEYLSALAMGSTSKLNQKQLAVLRESIRKQGFELPELSEAHVRKLPRDSRAFRSSGPRVGAELERLIGFALKLPVAAKSECKCNELKAAMDRNGVEWCRRNMDTVIVPSMLQNKDAIVKALRGHGMASRFKSLLIGVIPDSWVAAGCRKLIGQAIENAKAKARQVRSSRNPGTMWQPHPNATFIRSSQLMNDAITLAGMLPPDITAIAGVARSGLCVATMISMHLHLPMIAIRQTRGDVIDAGNGWRIGGSKHVDAKRQKVAVIDDTVMSGNSLRAIEPVLKQHFNDYVTATVYVNPDAARKPDLWVHNLPWPHLLEWNLFNSVLSPNMAMDFDGILCQNPTREQDDDGPKYLKFIQNAQPLYVPRKVPVPLIVTARIEKYRQPTEEWLAKHGIQFHDLVMHPATTTRDRERDDVVQYKARHFRSWADKHTASPPPLAFIESEEWQAAGIAQATGLMTICPAAGKVFGTDTPPEPELVEPVRFVREVFPTPKTKNAIVVVSGGHTCDQQLELSRPSIERYANKCGVDFIVLDGDQNPDWPLANKFRIGSVLDAYERTLYLDVDIFIADDAPSIFDYVPADRFAAWNEYGLIRDNLPGDWIQQQSDEWCDSQNIPRVPRTTMINAGVMLIPQRLASAYDQPAAPYPKHWCVDQNIITTRLQHLNEPVFWLDDRWHHGYLNENFFDATVIQQSFFLHFHGCRPHSFRLETMRRFSEHDYRRVMPPADEPWLPNWASRAVQ